MGLARLRVQEMECEERRIAAACIPERYRHCSLDSYVAHFSRVDPSLKSALQTAPTFAKEYMLNPGKGLLFTGSIGVGKIHLAVDMLQRLVLEYGVKGLFCDYRELLKCIQNSYNPQVQTT
jgi:DNA replication protein DnaC